MEEKFLKNIVEKVKARSTDLHNVNNKSVRFFTAKVTPKKIGWFVSIWKRVNGECTPYSAVDKIDYYVIYTEDQSGQGCFIFPEQVLLENGILSSTSKKGKLGCRLYPSWCKADNSTATKTQDWQKKYFFEIS
ncbi:MAG: MepB family protein [Rickettsiales bacterium]